jgi:hypothetical protein
MPSAAGLSPAAGRSWCASVRTTSASMCASPPSSWPRTRRAGPVPRRLQRVHREHRIPGGEQRRPPWAAVGLDPGLHLRITISRNEPADQLVQLPDPGRPSGNRRLASTCPASSITSMS